MKLELGKSYRTRDGEKVVIVSVDGGLGIHYPFNGDNNQTYREDGRMYSGQEDGIDLVALWEEEQIKISKEKVNHPVHYNKHPSGVECITITEHMGFNLGNAIKYIWRADLKGNTIEDLEKAAWYIDREIKRREKQNDFNDDSD